MVSVPSRYSVLGHCALGGTPIIRLHRQPQGVHATRHRTTDGLRSPLPHRRAGGFQGDCCCGSLWLQLGGPCQGTTAGDILVAIVPALPLVAVLKHYLHPSA